MVHPVDRPDLERQEHEQTTSIFTVAGVLRARVPVDDLVAKRRPCVAEKFAKSSPKVRLPVEFGRSLLRD